jgi:hypothetical protein
LYVLPRGIYSLNPGVVGRRIVTAPRRTLQEP